MALEKPPKEEPKSSRREFLHLGAALAYGAPAIHQYPLWPRPNKQVTVGYGPDAEYRLTDSDHHRTPAKAAYRNIGVIHNEEMGHTHHDFLRDAIDQNDLLLLEQGTPASSADYFDRLQNYALLHGKRAFTVDADRRDLTAFLYGQPGATGILTMCGVLYCSERIGKKPNASSIYRITRRAFHALGLGNLLSYFGLFREHQRQDSWEHPAEDGSYIADARTVAMLESIEELRRRFPMEQLVSITGDAHAKGIEYYLANPEEHQRRLQAYWPQYTVLGRGTEELTTPTTNDALPPGRIFPARLPSP